MLTKRIIPCLDIKNGRTVKGTNFLNLRDAGDPVELGARYADEGADELVFLDITATHEKRKTLRDLARRIAHHINIPFTVGGGISSVEDVTVLLENGADKISINSAAYKNPSLITELANEFGSQCIVLAIDVKMATNGDYFVYLNGGRIATESKCVDWVKKGVDMGAGELLITSMDHDGTKTGFAVELIESLAGLVNVPIIASGGGGSMAHFSEIFIKGRADAALAASIFHFKEVQIPDLKKYLKSEGVSVRF
jgi:imidazole glycerol-phosphate synthase subunit HisF